jgi:cell division protein FtsQ
MTFNAKKVRKSLRGLLALLIIAGAAYGLGWSNYFHVSSVDVRGTNQSALLLQDIRNARVILHASMPMARVDVKAMSASLSRELWLKQVHISRNWISGRVTISVIERRPVAQYISRDGTVNYFDSSGFAFNSPQGYGALPAVNIQESGSDSDAAALRTAVASFIAATPNDLITAMQSLTISRVDSISMVINLRSTPISIAWGSASDLPLKIKVLRALLARPDSAKAQSFDLSQPITPVTK